MKTILFLLFVFAANFAFAQRTVSGLIINKSQNPVKDVRVSVKNTSNSNFHKF